jgi:hypothetical protein
LFGRRNAEAEEYRFLGDLEPKKLVCCVFVYFFYSYDRSFSIVFNKVLFLLGKLMNCGGNDGNALGKKRERCCWVWVFQDLVNGSCP